MIRVADIQRTVAESYGVSVSDLKEPDGLGARSRDKVQSRQIGMYLARSHCQSIAYTKPRPISFNQIGRSFGNRDHSTVVHAIQIIAEKRLNNKELDANLSSLEREILATSARVSAGA